MANAPAGARQGRAGRVEAARGGGGASGSVAVLHGDAALGVGLQPRGAAPGTGRCQEPGAACDGGASACAADAAGASARSTRKAAARVPVMRHLPRAQCVRTRAPAPPLGQDTGCGGRSGATATAARMIAVSECLRAVRRAGQQTADGRPEAGQRTTRGADGATTAGRRKAASEHGAARPQNGGAPRGRRAARRGTARTRREYGGPGRAQAARGPAAPERGSSGRRPRGPGAGAVGGRRDGTRAQRGQARDAAEAAQHVAGCRTARWRRGRRRRAETGGERPLGAPARQDGQPIPPAQPGG